MAAFTSKATGNWSSAGETTWNEAGVPGDGDTVSIGAHTVTVDVNTTVGTSPNDATTKVVDITSGSGKLIIGTGVTLTALGNLGGANGATFQQEAGSNLTFDASASGGSPVYCYVSVGFLSFVYNGTSGSRCVVQAVSGRTFAHYGAWGLFTATYLTIRRCSAFAAVSVSVGGIVNVADTIFDTCAKLRTSSSSATTDFIFDRNEFVSGTNAAEDLQIDNTVNATTAVRRIYRCKFDKAVTYNSRSYKIAENYFGGGFSCVAGATWSTDSLNDLFVSDGSLNGTNGALFPTSLTRAYHVIARASGNPHFMSPTALLGADNVVSENIFESQSPDLTDNGDSIIVKDTSCSGGNKIVVRNNLVLRSGYAGAVSTSGVLVTLYNSHSSTLVECYNNTVCVDAHPVAGRQALLDFAEANTGTAGQVPIFKSNIAWGTASGAGYLAMRVTGNVKDIITAAGADYNWVFNTTSGDNQLGYEDFPATNGIWTAGDAVAAGVDAHQGSGDPAFVDKDRNIAKWNGARGYGAATYAAGLVALRADPSRIPDLIDYVFEGFKVTNVAAKTSAHDGGFVGAAGTALAAGGDSSVGCYGKHVGVNPTGILGGMGVYS